MSKTLGRYYLFLAILMVAGIGLSPVFAKEAKVNQPKAQSPEATVQQVLIAALNPEESKGFEAYLELMDADEKATPAAVAQIRRYSWKRFRRQAADYIVKDTKATFVVERRDPAKLTDATTKMRLFIKPVAHPRRTLAAPIRLKRRDGSWFVVSNSL